MRLSTRWLLILLLCAVASPPAQAVTVVDEHPRFLISQSDSLTIYNRIYSATTTNWFYKWKAAIVQQLDTTRASFVNGYMDDACLLSYITNDSTIKKKTRFWARHNLALGSGSPGGYGNNTSDGSIVGRANSAIFVWDWLQSEVQKYPTFRDSLKAHGLLMSSNAGWLAIYTGNWYDWQRPLFDICYAFHGDMDTAADNDSLDARLGRVLDLWTGSAEPCLSSFGGGGPVYYPGVYGDVFLVFSDCLRRGLPDYTDGIEASLYYQRFGPYWMHRITPRYSMSRVVQRYNSAGWSLGWMAWLSSVWGDPDAQAILNNWIAEHYTGTGPDYTSGNSLHLALRYDKNATASDSISRARSWSSDIGHYLYRDRWTVDDTSTAIQAAFCCGPDMNPNHERGQNALGIFRGSDWLLQIASGVFSDESNQHYASYCAKTVAHSSLRVKDDTAGLEDWGQAAPNTTRGDTKYPLCNGSVGWRGEADTLAATECVLWGVVGNADSAYVNTTFRRSVKALPGGWFVVQDLIDPNGNDAMIGWHTLGRPTNAAVYTTTEGDSAHGGVMETTSNLPLLIEQGESRAILYPAYCSDTMSVRLTGGGDASGASWRQSIAHTTTLDTYVASQDDQSFEHWIESSRLNRSRTNSTVSQAVIDARNTAYHAYGDWRAEWVLTAESEPFTVITLVEVGGTGLSARAVSSSAETGGTSVAVDGTNPIAVWEPSLTTSGFGEVAEAIVTVSSAGPVYVMGLADGTYGVWYDGTEIYTGLSVTDGDVTFSATDVGEWTVTQGEPEPPAPSTNGRRKHRGWWIE